MAISSAEQSTFHFKQMGEGGVKPGIDLANSAQVEEILDEEENHSGRMRLPTFSSELVNSDLDMTSNKAVLDHLDDVDPSFELTRSKPSA